MAKSPIRLPSSAVHQFSGSSQLGAYSQLLSSSLFSVNRSQGRQPLFQFLSEFPFGRGRPGPVGALLSLGCQLVILQPQLISKAGGQPGASRVFIGVGHFQHTPTLLFLQNLPSSVAAPFRKYIADNILPSLFVKIEIYHNSFES